MTTDECVIVGATGASALEPATMAATLESADWDIRAYELDRSTTRVLPISDDTALIACRVHEDVIVDGSDVRMDAYDVSVWQRRDGHWTCVCTRSPSRATPSDWSASADPRPRVC